ncbi:MAG: enoyl-CoA hydratase-related protein [Rhodoferax sp.]|uniref:enoyl-CoA hydratase-related protein n=1 Tax=Rhodoferax sp. TaxID=50421 RepID=UPI002633A535|nr:enoyl-CoA hydratase-related protein [Rhodoferax sp.]MDD2882291.1 enoyl-CoA hydratase-related protein [Rhodoferax sp.]
MRILLLTHSFNSLTQRLFGVLRAQRHTVSVELDIADSVAQEAVGLFQPDVVLAPFLKRRIPQSIWQKVVCLVVHPGVPGDRGPSALDWALMRGDKHWGVTVLQAVEDMDAGEVWAWQPLTMRPYATKSSLYRREVTDAAVHAVLRALQRYVPGRLHPNAPGITNTAAGTWNPLMPQAIRRIDWATDTTATVLQKIAAADGSPGVLDALFGQPCRLFDAHPASPAIVSRFMHSPPGTLLARRGPALLRRTVDDAVWIGHVRLEAPPHQLPAHDFMLKLPAALVFAAQAAHLFESPVELMRNDDEWDELRYREFGPEGARVGWLDFEFHNGAMSERQCLRLRDALRWVRTRPTQLLVLAGGQDFFSNGIHLHDIEAAQRVAGDSAADASWRNINAMNDATLEVLTLTDRITVAALHGNAGAGGCFLALATDLVWAHAGVVLNPHYKNMGNLYGSEYWTYSLPRRLGEAASLALMQQRLPLSAPEAVTIGVLDDCFGSDGAAFSAQVLARCLAMAGEPGLAERLNAKQVQREHDEMRKPLATYRDEELNRMNRNFYGFDPSYHVARHHFVFRKPHAWTPRHLALHRELKPASTPSKPA